MGKSCKKWGNDKRIRELEKEGKKKTKNYTKKNVNFDKIWTTKQAKGNLKTLLWTRKAEDTDKK